MTEEATFYVGKRLNKPDSLELEYSIIMIFIYTNMNYTKEESISNKNFIPRVCLSN